MIFERSPRCYRVVAQQSKFLVGLYVSRINYFLMAYIGELAYNYQRIKIDFDLRLNFWYTLYADRM